MSDKSVQFKVPRLCLGCRERDEKENLIRIALGRGEGSLLVDREKILPGRGAYFHSRANCLKKGLNKKILERALRSRIAQSEIDLLLKELV